MSISAVSNGQTQAQTFKGKFKKADNGTPYYHTNSGTVTGAIMAVPAGLHWARLHNNLSTSKEEYDKQMKGWLNHFIKNANAEKKKGFEEELKDGLKNVDEKFFEHNKSIKKRAIPCGIAAAALTLGCGILVDYLRNKKAQEIAEITKQIGNKRALTEVNNTAISNKGRVYYNSNTGSKYGALLGAACGVIATAMRYSKNAPKLFLGTGVLNILGFALGGWLLGKITDSNTNKDARKHA